MADENTFDNETLEDISYKLNALIRRVAAHSAAIQNSVAKNNLYTQYQPINIDDHPDVGENYSGETHSFFVTDNYPKFKDDSDTDTYTPPTGIGGFLETITTSESSVGGQYFYPVSDSGNNGHGWEIWYRRKAGKNKYNDWMCINGIDEEKLSWWEDDDL